MNHPSQVVVSSIFDIVLLYEESQSLIAYWLFLNFALLCHINDRSDPRTGSFFKFLSMALPLIWYFNQPLEPGETLHLALPTIFGWTFIGMHLLRNPLGTAVSLYMGAQAYKYISKD